MATPKKTAETKPLTTEPGDVVPLENMPERPKTIPHVRSERLFCAWKGEIVGTENPPMEVIIRGIRIFGIKAECTEFAVDQEPAWKWVETAKDRDVVADIIEKAKNR